MDSFNFPAIILHPNTEDSLIQKRNLLLKEELRNLIPLYPLYGIFEEPSFSQELKNKYRQIKNCQIAGTFCTNSILFSYGQFIFNDKEMNFLIPTAIEKKTDSKNILSVYKTSYKVLNEFKRELTDVKKFQIPFRSFQIADCHVSKNEYRLFENFWIKIST